MTRYHRQDVLNDRNLFLSLGDWEVQGQGAGWFGSWWELSSSFAYHYLVSLHDKEKERGSMLSLVFSHKGTDIAMAAPLSWLNYFLKTPSPYVIALGIKVLIYKFSEDTNPEHRSKQTWQLKSLPSLHSYFLSHHIPLTAPSPSRT